MKTGSGYDRTFPDCMMTFVFGWGRQTSNNSFASPRLEAQLASMQDEFEKVIADYQVSSNERIKHMTNEMLMLGHCDSNSHSPLMVDIRSRAANPERNYLRTKEFFKGKKHGSRGTNARTAIKDGSVAAIRPREITSTAVSLTAAIIGITRNDKLLRLPPLATIQTSFGLHDSPGIRFSEA